MKNYVFPETCPGYLKQSHYGAIRRYVVDGISPGHFMQAVLSNDLMEAMGRADDESVGDLKAITMFIYNDVPGMCCGNKDAVREWLAGKHREYRPDEDGSLASPTGRLNRSF